MTWGDAASVPQILLDLFDLDPDCAGVGNVDQGIFRLDDDAVVGTLA